MAETYAGEQLEKEFKNEDEVREIREHHERKKKLRELSEGLGIFWWVVVGRAWAIHAVWASALVAVVYIWCVLRPFNGWPPSYPPAKTCPDTVTIYADKDGARRVKEAFSAEK